MFETISKAMMIGLGAADLAAERVQQTIKDLVERGDVTADQGKQLYSDIMSRMEERGRTENERVHKYLHEAMRDVGIPDRKQMAVIKARMDALDNKLEQILERLPELDDAKSESVV